MNRFDEFYIFRHAVLADCEMIMEFIREEWPKKNHILAQEKDFFLYEFQNGEKINFVIAVNKKTDLIDGMMGFIPASDIKETLDVWACIWLTRRKGSMPFLGAEVLNRMKDIINYRYLSGVGTNPKTAMPVAKSKAGHYVYKLNHYYMLSERNEYKVAKIEKKIMLSQPNNVKKSKLKQAFNVNEILDSITASKNCCIPLKNEWYINKRFFCHPVYNYLVWDITSDSGKGVLVAREVEANGVKVLRIVDFMGEPQLFDGLYDEFQLLMKSNDYEYIDFYIYGIDKRHLNNAGFVLKTEEDGNIIPNYFEPFVQCNVEIHGTSTSPSIRMCKADADQDRPNTV